MHTLVITFDLVDMTHERYTEVCAELAPAFAAVPGLLAKIWLTDQDEGPLRRGLPVRRRRGGRRLPRLGPRAERRDQPALRGAHGPALRRRRGDDRAHAAGLTVVGSAIAV